MARLVSRLYRDTPRPDYPINRNAPLRQRNQAIHAGYAQGQTLEGLAARFDLSVQRVHQIIAHRRR
jgi:Mor family transcriptional regulator